jgi:hypothetical protein
MRIETVHYVGMRHAIALVTGLMLLGGTAHAARTSDLRLAPHKLGPVRVGMTAEQATDAVGRAVLRERGEFCDSFRIAGEPRGISLIGTKRRHITLMLVFNKRYETTRGIRIGDTLDDLRAAYGRKLRRVPAGNDLSGAASHFGVVKRAGGSRFLLRFALDDRDKVRFMEAGKRRTVLRFGECA